MDRRKDVDPPGDPYHNAYIGGIMDTQNDSTERAPARDALAAWDKLFHEREVLNGYLDCSNDFAYHELKVSCQLRSSGN